MKKTKLQTWMIIAFGGGGGETTDDPHRPRSLREHQGKPFLQTLFISCEFKPANPGGKEW